ncbi:MAG: hypothetical protein IKP71_14390, partial [Candidatus Riflebacteria bacterium]|nr:hypothetical protein [Candidatus Riflebacteria bacterium]
PLPDMGDEKAVNDIIITANDKIVTLPMEFTSNENSKRVNCTVNANTGVVTGLNVGPALDLSKYYGTWTLIKQSDPNNRKNLIDVQKSFNGNNSTITIASYGVNVANAVISKTYIFHEDYNLLKTVRKMCSVDLNTVLSYSESFPVSTFTCRLDGDIWKISRFWSPSNYASVVTSDVDYRIELTSGSLDIYDPDKNKINVSVKDNVMTITDMNEDIYQLTKEKANNPNGFYVYNNNINKKDLIGNWILQTYITSESEITRGWHEEPYNYIATDSYKTSKGKQSLLSIKSDLTASFEWYDSTSNEPATSSYKLSFENIATNTINLQYQSGDDTNPSSYRYYNRNRSQLYSQYRVEISSDKKKMILVDIEIGNLNRESQKIVYYFSKQ